MVAEIRSLGFDRIELGHGLRPSLAEGVDRLIRQEDVRVTSVHSCCPVPVDCIHGMPPARVLSSERESERRKALRDMLQTLDFAARVGAPTVVVHLGFVPMQSFTRMLRSYTGEGQRSSPAHLRTIEKAWKVRAAKGQKAFARAMQSLEALVPAARERHLMLGIESRYQLEEIPSESELEAVLKAFDRGTVGYWHDTGHVQSWENLGLTDHARWLEKFRARLIGSHVHDVIFPTWDHQLPGRGAVAFERLEALCSPETLKVFELAHDVPVEEIRQRLPAFMARLEPAPPPGRGGPSTATTTP